MLDVYCDPRGATNTIASSLITGPEIINLNKFTHHLHYRICRCPMKKISPVTFQCLLFLNNSKKKKSEREKEKQKQTQPHRTTLNHVTSDHTPQWPFLVGGVICLITSVDERYLVLLNGVTCDSSLLLRGTLCV